VDLQVDPPEPTVAIGATATVYAQAIKADHTTAALTAADWSVADPTILSFTSDKATRGSPVSSRATPS
jgi:hypothetical protein